MSGAINNRINNITKALELTTIANEYDRGIQVIVDDLNGHAAASIPTQKYIGINSTMLKLWTTAELRAVLGHEIAHILFYNKLLNLDPKEIEYYCDKWAVDVFGATAKDLITALIKIDIHRKQNAAFILNEPKIEFVFNDFFNDSSADTHPNTAQRGVNLGMSINEIIKVITPYLLGDFK